MRYAYDIECFKNLFIITFINLEDEKDIKTFSIGLGRQDLPELSNFMKQEMTLVGYNNHSYDDPMLRYVLGYKGKKFFEDIFVLSSKLIDDGYRSDKDILALRYPKNVVSSWNSIDLMKILAFDKLGISLKQTAINLKWYKIQDMPVNPYEKINEEDVKTIIEYNINDVLIAKKLYEEIAPIRELRDSLSKIYSVDFSSASDSKIANLIFEHVYANELKMDVRSLRNMRTRRPKVFLRDCIAKFVNFKTSELNEMLKRISSTYVYDYNRYKYSEKIYFAGCSFSLGVGGLHTEDAPGIFVTDDKYIIQDMDVASYYPNLIINNKFYPEHLGENFIRVLKKITAERLEAKKKKDKVKADGLKITINSIFGKLGSETFWLLDAKQMLSTTVSGQLGLLMLVEDLFLNGIEIISCNTDGIVCKIPRELENKYYEIAKNWEKQTNLELEFTLYKKYVRRDVNSYITEKQDGTTKEKGAFVKEIDLKKAYHMPIVAKALYAYFIKGVPVKKTLEDCKDIMEFCISQKTGANFIMELHTTAGIEKLQKTNRYFITKKGGSLMKREQYSKKVIGLNVGRLVQILNLYDPSVPFENYHVDLSFYEKEVMKIIDEVEPKQMTLFDSSSLGYSTMKKMEIPEKKQEEYEEEKITVSELNKLGKNQRVKKIESIVDNRQKINGISPRYVYIYDFSVSEMAASVYCLAKGIFQVLDIDTTAYKKEKIEKGKIVYCSKFEKRSNGYAMVEYRITEKIEEQKDKLI